MANPSDFITYNSLCTKAKNKYRDLVASKHYSPAQSSGPSDAVTFKAAICFHVNQAFTAALAASGLTNKKQEGNTSNCNQGKGQCSSKDKWTEKPPGSGIDPATATCNCNNKTYKWCSICKLWHFHYASGHDAWQRCQEDKLKSDSAPASDSSNTKKLASDAPADTKDATDSPAPAGQLAINNDNLFSFGGLLSIDE